jgi:hypothetical protein
VQSDASIRTMINRVNRREILNVYLAWDLDTTIKRVFYAADDNVSTLGSREKMFRRAKVQLKMLEDECRVTTFRKLIS